MADVFGGSGWFAQQFQAALEAALLEFQRQQATGYIKTGTSPTAARRQALQAIWDARPDIKALYDKNWGKNYDPLKAVEDWLSWTPEVQTPGPTPDGQLGDMRYKNPRDPIEYAVSQGLMDRPEPQQERKTLEREQFEADEEYRNKMLELQERSYDLQEELQLNDHEFQQMMAEADRLFQREIHDDKMAFERAKQAFEEKYALESFEFEKLMRTKELDLETRKLELSGQVHADTMALEQQKLNFQRYDTDLQAELRREQMEIDRQYNQGQLELGQGELALGRDRLAAETALSQQRLGLDYLTLLAAQRGPQDWLSYWNTVRGAENTNLPAWAASLVQGQTQPLYQAASGPMQPFQGFMGVGPAPYAMPQDMQQGIAGMPTGQPAPEQQSMQQGGMMPQQPMQQGPGALPYIAPNMVTPQQWNRMLPSEQAGLQGLVEAQGGYMPDWMRQMQALWPKGQVTGISFYGG